MATTSQIKQTESKLREYRRKYLQKKFQELDESATRLMVNSLLKDVLGYSELDEIKTEYEIKGAYADYVIQLNRKKWFVVEVKAISIDLNEKHLRQSQGYAANEGIDWAILSNGRQIELYRVIFSKPINVIKLFSFDLSDAKQLDDAAKVIIFLTKKSVIKNELDTYWKRSSALSNISLAKALYSEDVAKIIRRHLKKESGITFTTEDILTALQPVINNSQELKLKLKKRLG